jgi:hypothetical protein
MIVGVLGAGVAVWGFWPSRREIEKKGKSNSNGSVSIAAAPEFTGVRISGEF